MIFIYNFSLAKELIKIKPDFFYCPMFLYILYSMLINQRADEGSLILSGLNDKNYSAVFVYLVFLYSNKKKYISGIFIGIVYGLFFTHSRSYLLLIILFYIFYFFKGCIYSLMENLKISIFKFMCILFVCTILLSFIWVFFVASDNVTAQYVSLNDESNLRRFAGNIKTLTLLRDSFKDLLFGGYGYEYYEVLGINVSTYSQLPDFMGVKLVQAHNSILNNFAIMGILPGLIYMYLVCKIFQKEYSMENLPYLLPYLINSMFMHSLFNGRYLLLFLIVLVIQPDKLKLAIKIPHIKLSKIMYDINL